MYFIGLAIYLITVSMSYSDKSKAAFWYYPLGMALSLVTNYLWMNLAKTSDGSNQVYVRGIVWDSMIVLAYSVLPFFCFNVKLTAVQSLGAGLVIIGLGLIKLA
jgi:hypothetical protein